MTSDLLPVDKQPEPSESLVRWVAATMDATIKRPWDLPWRCARVEPASPDPTWVYYCECPGRKRKDGQPQKREGRIECTGHNCTSDGQRLYIGQCSFCGTIVWKYMSAAKLPDDDVIKGAA